MSEGSKGNASQGGEPGWRRAHLETMGGLTTLIINICAFCMACIATVQTIFIMDKVLGHHGPSDGWPMFIPVAFMFFIHRKAFSIFFLLVFLLLLCELSYEIRQMRNGVLVPKYSLGASQAIVFILWLICFLLYIIGAAIKILVKLIALDRGEGARQTNIPS
jgi:hypothetical protein